MSNESMVDHDLSQSLNETRSSTNDDNESMIMDNNQVLIRSKTRSSISKNTEPVVIGNISLKFKKYSCCFCRTRCARYSDYDQSS